MRPKEYLGVADVARRMRRSEGWVRALLRTGRLQGMKIGRAWLIPVAQFDEAGEVEEGFNEAEGD